MNQTGEFKSSLKQKHDLETLLTGHVLYSETKACHQTERNEVLFKTLIPAVSGNTLAGTLSDTVGTFHCLHVFKPLYC